MFLPLTSQISSPLFLPRASRRNKGGCPLAARRTISPLLMPVIFSVVSSVAMCLAQAGSQGGGSAMARMSGASQGCSAMGQRAISSVVSVVSGP